MKLFFSILICQFAGIIGALFTQQAIPEWYFYIQKPLFSPPNWVFAPVWTLLYLLMGIAAYLVWRLGLSRKDVKSALAIFLLQLVLNSSWSIVFFGGRSISGGMIVIVLLWLAILWTMRSFYAVSKPACFLLIPYIIWVSFALILNLALLTLN